MSEPVMQQLELSKLGLPQLAQLKQQLDQDLTVFQDSWNTLKIAQEKFVESGDVVGKVVPGKEILVPLTGSMYVPGTVSDSDKVLIDIGTGYYVEKSLDEAKDYFKRKVEFVATQMEKIQAFGVEKNQIRDAVILMIEAKIHSMQAQNPQPTTS